MSDFLGNLIQRHEQPKPLLRPRLASLFETASVAAASLAPKAAEEASFGEINIETNAPAAQSENRRVAAAPLPTARKPIARDERDAEPEAALLPPRIAPERAQPHPAGLREEPVREEAPAFVMPARATPNRVAAESPAPLERLDTPLSTIQPPVETRVVRHVLEETIVRDIGSGLMPPPIQEMPQAPASAIRPIPQPPLPEPPRPSPFEMPRAERPQPTRSETRRQASDTPRIDAEPVVHVSIGRIEIRASEEREARPRKSSAPSSVMTLDEYLKSRAKR